MGYKPVDHRAHIGMLYRLAFMYSARHKKVQVEVVAGGHSDPRRRAGCQVKTDKADPQPSAIAKQGRTA